MTDIKRLFGSLIWEYDSTELSAILKDKENPVPMGMALVLGALTEDLKNKNLANFERLMDRAYGKPTQGVDISTSGNLQVITMTSEERRKRIKELLEEARQRTGNEADKPDGK
jgi:hypothetical protein